jgi:histidinol-phosphate aminotransferase
MNFQSEKCKAIEPYVCGEQPQDKKYIKLNTNENPYPPSPMVKKVLTDTDIDKLKLYPDPENTLLKETIAKKYNVLKNQVFVGNGSDEVLSFIFPAFFNEKGKC